jgi:hypothetical protein
MNILLQLAPRLEQAGNAAGCVAGLPVHGLPVVSLVIFRLTPGGLMDGRVKVFTGTL